MRHNYGCGSRIGRIQNENYNAERFGVQRPAYEEPRFDYVNYGTNSNYNNNVNRPGNGCKHCNQGCGCNKGCSCNQGCGCNKECSCKPWWEDDCCCKPWCNQGCECNQGCGCKPMPREMGMMPFDYNDQDNYYGEDMFNL